MGDNCDNRFVIEWCSYNLEIQQDERESSAKGSKMSREVSMGEGEASKQMKLFHN